MLKEMWYDFKELLMASLVFLGVFVVLIVCLLSSIIAVPVVGSIWYEQGYCRTQTELAPEYNFEWKLFGGCLIEVENGTWVHALSYINKEWKDIQGNLTIDE